MSPMCLTDIVGVGFGFGFGLTSVFHAHWTSLVAAKTEVDNF